MLAFAGSPQSAKWLDEEQAEALLGAAPDANIAPEQAADFLRKAIEGFGYFHRHLDEAARQRSRNCWTHTSACGRRRG